MKTINWKAWGWIAALAIVLAMGILPNGRSTPIGNWVRTVGLLAMCGVNLWHELDTPKLPTTVLQRGIVAAGVALFAISFALTR